MSGSRTKLIKKTTGFDPIYGISGVSDRKILLAFLLILATGLVAAAPGSHQINELNETAADSVDEFGMADLCWIDDLVEEAIRTEHLPGAVILVGKNDRILYYKSFGHRSVFPALEPMTIDTVFDLASVTKVVATTTSVMQLVEAGRIFLEDPVTQYIPQFARHGKSTVTVRNLLTHMSGLRPGINPARRWEGYNAAIEQIANDELVTPPGERIVYSDLNFILLGEIVRRVSGMSLDLFARHNLFQPLGMSDTMYNPPLDMQSRIAPTDRCQEDFRSCGDSAGAMLRGRVHDPTARRMGDGPGHAGLFSTAEDLSIFCRMVLNRGAIGATRILSPATIDRMISPATPLIEGQIRGLGWNLDNTYGEPKEKQPQLPIDHSGFTGTKLWLDTESGLYVIFLSNRLHPSGKGDVFDLREHIVTIATSFAAGRVNSAGSAVGVNAAKIQQPNLTPIMNQPRGQVLSGLDVLRSENFKRLRGTRIGLLTNQTGLARDGIRTIDLFHRTGNLRLINLFSPEHGLHGSLNDRVPSSRDKKTGLVIHSLYGRVLRPTTQMLSEVDTIVVDLQDIGTRFYTYMTTMAYMLEAASRNRIRIVVLDRPNPINGIQIEGPVLDRKFMGFTGYFPMPVRHGMTIGELARLFNGENAIGANLTVIKMKGWRRQYWFDETGLPWVNPSPNMRNLIQATLYPGIGAIEGTRISVGRGTDTPFEQIGAPWIDGIQLAADLNARDLAGVRFYPVSFRPQSSKFAGKTCGGVFILVTDRQAFLPVRLGLEVAATLHRSHPAEYALDKQDNLLGSETVLRRILAGEDPGGIVLAWKADEEQWRQLRNRHLLY